MKQFFIFIFILLIQIANINILNAQQSIDEWLNQQILKNASVGLLIIDRNTKEIIFEKNENISLTPASCMKLFSTATAIEVLGENFRFKTEIAYSGNIDKNGTLNGDLYIIGYGDPALGSERFAYHYLKPINYMNLWVKSVKDAGIKKIEGKVIGDASEFCLPYQPISWLYEDIGNYYGASISGLSINENTYKLNFSTGQNIGDSTTLLSMTPNIPNYFFNNQTTSINKEKDDAYIIGGALSSNKLLIGTLPYKKTSYTIKGSIDNPPLFAAQLFTEELQKNGISISNQPSSINYKEQKPDVKVLHTTYSPNLKQLCDATNTWSINLYAEHLAIATAKQLKSEKENWFKSIVEFWNKKGMDTDGFQMIDGSGLSVFNTVTVAQLVYLLNYMQSESKNAKIFLSSLPIAGQTGTLANYCKNSFGKGNIFAKTGGMNGVRSVAGYANTKSGKNLTFALIINHYDNSKGNIKDCIEQLLNIITEIN